MKTSLRSGKPRRPSNGYGGCDFGAPRSRPMKRVRLGVVGAGRIAQAAHLPWILAESARFELCGIADVAPELRRAVGARYGVAAFPTLGALLELDLDAVVCATPASMHALTVIPALEAGLHVLCEKPVAFSVGECDAIAKARDRAGCLVQVGYMKRFDPAAVRLLTMLPETCGDVRYISVEVIDPHDQPFTERLGLLQPDVPSEWQREIQERELRQVHEATGTDLSPDAYWAYRHGYLASLVHDVNIVHAILAVLGERVPADVADARYWAAGSAVQLSLKLSDGGWANLVHVARRGVPQYLERIAIHCVDRTLELEFPSPFLARRCARLVER